MIAGVIAGGRPYAASNGWPSTIGEAFGGGYYVGDVVVGADTYAIIMAGASGQSEALWKSAGTDTPGTGSLVDGVSNSASMLAATGHPAAIYCDTYVSGIYGDWYLPAKGELNLAWVNRANLLALGMGGTSYYWSSTQSSAAAGWRQYFNNGAQQSYSKAYALKIRPVRRIKL